MKLLVFFRPDSEFARITEQYIRDLSRNYDLRNKEVLVLSPDTREGSDKAVLYDIMAFPGIVVTDNDGGFIKSWSGQLPLQDELMSYLGM